jgi:hypothetical protein
MRMPMRNTATGNPAPNSEPTKMHTSFSTIAFAAADLSNGSTVETIAATDVAVIPATTFNAPSATSNVAPIAVPKRNRKLSGAATKPATEAVKPAAKPAAEKPVAEMHAFGTSYNGASPPVRAHGKLLSPIVLDRIPNAYTARDAALAAALYKANGLKPFQRLNIDAGALSRLIGHKIVAHVSGNLDQRDCKFSITKHAEKTRFAKA